VSSSVGDETGGTTRSSSSSIGTRRGIRFAIEFVRINERVVGPHSVAHPASMLAMVIGFIFLLRSRLDTQIQAAKLSELSKTQTPRWAPSAGCCDRSSDPDHSL